MDSNKMSDHAGMKLWLTQTFFPFKSESYLIFFEKSLEVHTFLDDFKEILSLVTSDDVFKCVKNELQFVMLLLDE